MTEKSMTPEEAAKEIAEFYGWRFPHPEILDIIHQQRAQERKLCFAEIETIDELRHKIGEKYDIAYGDSDWISNMVESIIYKQRAQAVEEFIDSDDMQGICNAIRMAERERCLNRKKGA